MASARIQRWALTLSAYHYEICYKPGADHANADGLSRLPVSNHVTTVPLPGDVLLLFQTLQSTPVRADQIRQWTDTDPILSRIRRNVLSGWVDSDDPELQPYQLRAAELSVQDGCLQWGSRVVVPEKGREAVMSLLHEGHPGITRMKRLARGYVWWPGMDTALEVAVQTCTECQKNQKSPARAPMHPWEWPDCPWARIHIDYAGPVRGKMILVVVDSHSKWIEAHVVNSSTSQATIEKLRLIFSTQGLPQVIVSDNGTSFTSEEFAAFVRANGIKHLTSAPYHPASNGLAERAVQTLKKALKKDPGKTNLETQILHFLFRYRITPHSTTGVTPAELLLGRRPRSRLDLLHPDISRRFRQRQWNQKEGHDQHCRQRELSAGQTVWVRNPGTGRQWFPGTISQVLSHQRFRVSLEDGCIVDRHIDHVRRRVAVPGKNRPEPSTDPVPPDLDVSEDSPEPAPDPPAEVIGPPPQPALRRSARDRRPPERFT